MIKMKNIKIYKKIHLKDFEKFDFACLDMFGEYELKRGNGHHTLQIEISHYRERIIEFVEDGNDKETIEKIVEEWRVPSYNNLDEPGRGFAHYELWCDEEGFIDRIVIMPRVCPYILEWFLISNKLIYNVQTIDI